jgi:hypothetical protein
MNGLEKRVDRLEYRGHARRGLAVLETSELQALLEALKEEDRATRDAKLAAIGLRPESEGALVEFIAELEKA